MTTVRIATNDDVDALARLRFAMDREQEGGTTEFATFQEKFADWYAIHGENVIAFVAEEGGKIVGTLWLLRVARVPRPSNLDPEPLGYVSFFFVDAAHRGRGVGKALLNALTAHADEESFDTLVVWPAERAGGNYRDVGFIDPPELLERLGPVERELQQR
jgi:GNAT superfamily N-acetyltransferase